MADDTRKVRVVEQLKIKIGKFEPSFPTKPIENVNISEMTIV